MADGHNTHITTNMIHIQNLSLDDNTASNGNNKDIRGKIFIQNYYISIRLKP